MSDTLDHIEYKPKVSIETPIQDHNQTDILTVASGGSISFIGNLGNRGIKYLYSIALVWSLGAENFGLFTLALSIATFVGVIANLGMNQSIIRFGAIYNHSEGRIGIHRTTIAAMRIVLPFGLFLMLTLLLFADTIAVNIFKKPELASLIRALGLSVPFMSVQESLLAATTVLKTMKYMVAVWFFQPLIGLLLAVPLMINGMGVHAVALSLTVSYILASGLAFYFYMRVIYCKEKKAPKIPMWNLIKFSLPLTFTQWIQFANDRIELFFLGLMPGAIDVGIYKMADSLAGLEPTLRESLGRIMAPFSSDLSHRKEIKQLETLYKTTAKWSFSLALALFLIFLLFAESIMNIIDPAFVAGVGVLIALGFAYLFYAATGSSSTVLVMSGRSDLSLLNTIVLSIMVITLSWFLIPSYGLSGAAVAGTLSIIMVNILRVVEVWLTLKIHPFNWNFAKPIVAGLVSFSLVFGLSKFTYSGGMMDLVYSIIFIGGYIAILFLLKLDAEDIMVLNAMRERFTFSKRT